MLPAQRKLADGQAAVREDVEHLTLGAPRAARHWLVRVRDGLALDANEHRLVPGTSLLRRVAADRW